MAKRIVVIGLGNFGASLAARLHQLRHEVVAVDTDPELVDAMGSKVAQAFVGDATRKGVLEEAGAREADMAVISTGDNLAASILALLALKDLKVRSIFVKVGSEEHARIAESLGAEEVIFPERESALGLASRITGSALLQYVSLGPNLSIQEMAVPEAWQGKTIRQLELPQKYQAQVVAIHDILRDEMTAVPSADRTLTSSDTLLLAGSPTVLERLARMA